jgi:hypothetical protein
VTVPAAPRVRPAVAVVAVHGVADQAPNSSAEAIAGLLLEYGDGARTYAAAREITLHIPTRPALVTHAPRRSTFFDDARAPGAAALADTGRHEPNAAPDHQLMRSQLQGYKSRAQPYRTVRLETQRLDLHGRPDVDVHVYEMYWADLSRLGTGVLRFFSELYQLLFHSANLGRQTLDYAALEHDDGRLWRWLCGVHKWAVRILTIFIPVVALVILFIGSTPIALAAPPRWQSPMAVALFGAAGALILAARRYRRGAPKSLALWTLGWVLGIALLAGLARWALTWREAHLTLLLVTEWLLVGGLMLLLVLRAYDRYRPGALQVGMGLYVLGAVGCLGMTFSRAAANTDTRGLTLATVQATRGVLTTVEALWLAGNLAWGLFCLAGVISWLSGAFAVHVARKAVKGAPDQEEAAAVADRAARAVRTSRLTLALPAAAFMLVTTILWYVVVYASEALLQRSTLASLLEVEHCPLVLPCGTIKQFVDALLWNITTLGLPLAALLLVIGLGLLGWWLVPIARTEARLPADHETAQDPSHRMGVWLSTGMAYALLWIARVVAIAVIVGVVAYLVSYPMTRAGDADPGIPPTIARQVGTAIEAAAGVVRGAIEFLGGFLVAGAVGVLALRRGRLEKLSRSVRPMLDVVLDVDGYLREHPRERTPRARIAERYVSLLRYLCAWRNPDAPDAPYSAIIILAHSQGTVISTDLLGFLRREHDPALDPIVQEARAPGGSPTIPTYLFTMGSPLRQLYEQFFPHLYSWVARRPKAWRHADLVAPAAAAPPPEKLLHNPDPTGLRVSQWVNAYRSGDYVGRYLWLQETAEDRFWPEARNRDSQGRRCDLCVGAGAHTHYWDSRLIAQELGALIAEGAMLGP